MNIVKRLLSMGALVFLGSTIGAIVNGNNYSNSACATLVFIALLIIANTRRN